MSALEQAARMALEAPGCERLREWAAIGPVQRAAVESFAAALDAGQAQPVAPFGYVSEHNCEGPFRLQFHRDQSTVYPDNCKSITPVYASPPARQPLTEAEVETIARADWPADIDWAMPENIGVTAVMRAYFRKGFRAAERAHGIT